MEILLLCIMASIISLLFDHIYNSKCTLVHVRLLGLIIRCSHCDNVHYMSCIIANNVNIIECTCILYIYTHKQGN